MAVSFWCSEVKKVDHKRHSETGVGVTDLSAGQIFCLNNTCTVMCFKLRLILSNISLFLNELKQQITKASFKVLENVH